MYESGDDADEEFLISNQEPEGDLLESSDDNSYSENEDFKPFREFVEVNMDTECLLFQDFRSSIHLVEICRLDRIQGYIISRKVINKFDKSVFCIL